MTEDRRQEAYRRRVAAAERARSRHHPDHLANGDEQRLSGERYAMSFTKGLCHGEDGLLIEPADFEAFRTAIDNGYIAAFTDHVPVPTEHPRRLWEAPTAGAAFDLQGPDAQAVTMAPAPALGSKELAYEMAEVYELALLRDLPLTAFQTEALTGHHPQKTYGVKLPEPKEDALARSVETSIGRLAKIGFALDGEGGRRPRITGSDGTITAQEAFRGSSPGVEVGPYLSQFMLIGSPDGGSPAGVSSVAGGRIAYGSISIDQKVARATECLDFMIEKDEWLHVQQGYEPTPQNSYDGTRFISTPRDLATYVHFDALYEAYLNACLILINMKAPVDPGFATLAGGGGHVVGGVRQTRQDDAPVLNAGGFALYGGPHILTLVTEVATRALKAVRFQKFNNHIRLRPETLAGRLACLEHIDKQKGLARLAHLLKEMKHHLTENGPDDLAGTIPAIVAHNEAQGGEAAPFLPMAFPEGSPMHPAYGAGHATVAGACVTMLKAFFDTDAVFVLPEGKKENEAIFKRVEAPGKENGKENGKAVDDTPVAYVSDYCIGKGTGQSLLCLERQKPLTLEGELNKLAANISIGRNMAGVHYFSDYYDSLRMGERIALGMLEEQALTYPTDRFVLSVPTFDGPVVRIGRA